MPESEMRQNRWVTHAILLLLAALVALGTFTISVWRYQTFRSVWPLDLAYFNHQLWNLSHGVAPLTLQPGNFYANEGPEPWRMAQMRLLTLLLWPIYAVCPGVCTLFAVQSLACAAGVWPMHSIAARRSGSQWGVAAATFYAVAPPIWLFGTQDFRYLTLGIPLALLAYDALERHRRSQYVGWAILAMAARQVFAVLLAALAAARAVTWLIGKVLRRPSQNLPVQHGLRWLVGPVLLSVGWLALDQVWLHVQYGPGAVAAYWRGMQDLAAHTSRLDRPIPTVFAAQRPYVFRYGTPTLLAALAAPECGGAAAVLMMPPLRMGQWALHPADLFSRYTVPVMVVLLVGAAVTFGRLGRWHMQSRRRLPAALAGSWLLLAACTGGRLVWDVLHLPSALTRPEREAIDMVLRRIAPGDAVLASHLEAYGAYHVVTRQPGEGNAAVRSWHAFSVLPLVSSRSRVFDYNQLPRVATAAHAQRNLTLEEVLDEVDWCVLLRPPDRTDRTPAVRAAIVRDERFGLSTSVGRLDVYRRKGKR